MIYLLIHDKTFSKRTSLVSKAGKSELVLLLSSLRWFVIKKSNSTEPKYYPTRI